MNHNPGRSEPACRHAVDDDAPTLMLPSAFSSIGQPAGDVAL
jgi:hypothetical protein